MHKWKVWIWFYNPSLVFRKLSTSWICSIIFSINIIITLSFSFRQFPLLAPLSLLSSIYLKDVYLIVKPIKGATETEDYVFEGSLGYIRRPCSEKKAKWRNYIEKIKQHVFYQFCFSFIENSTLHIMSFDQTHPHFSSPLAPSYSPSVFFFHQNHTLVRIVYTFLSLP